MTVQGTISAEGTSQARGAIESASLAGSRLVGGWARYRSQPLVVLLLVFSDVLLALAVWQTAFALQGILGNGPLSRIALASMAPNVVVWVGLRASLGLYPGYGLGAVEDLRRQTFALLATVTITLVFAFASPVVGDSLSRVLLFAWSAGLLLLAPMSRYAAKWAMMRAGLWGRPVAVLGAGEAGARVEDSGAGVAARVQARRRLR